jgi:hypothetical protein
LFCAYFSRGFVRYRINRQYRLEQIYLVEVKKSIYALRAKKINKMKKAKHKIQWANLACWISRFASFAGKRRNRCNEQNIRTLEKKEKIFAKYTLCYSAPWIRKLKKKKEKKKKKESAESAYEVLRRGVGRHGSRSVVTLCRTSEWCDAPAGASSLLTPVQSRRCAWCVPTFHTTGCKPA